MNLGGQTYELGLTVYRVTSPTLPPSQSWQPHYCYWPLLFLSLFSSTSWNNTTAAEALQLLQINVCLQTICNNYIDVKIFAPSSWFESMLDLKCCPEIINPFHVVLSQLADLPRWYQRMFIFLWNSSFGEDVQPGQHSSKNLFWFSWWKSIVRRTEEPVNRGRCCTNLLNSRTTSQVIFSFLSFFFV